MASTEELFNKDLRDVHLIYNYDVLVDGTHESTLPFRAFPPSPHFTYH